MQLNLTSHPATPSAQPDFKVWASVDHSAAFGATATTNIWFGIGAPASRFVIPSADEPSRAKDLWQTTCLEAFFRESGSPSYQEWNFAPSGDWAAYAFSAYREGMTDLEVGAPPYIRMEDNLTWWTLGATIAVEAGKNWEFNLAGVLEEKDGTKSYWALAHAPDKPDFHHADCFVAKLP
jgi:hypothetical protein